MIDTLGITHILNISDSCENYLQDSHRKCVAKVNEITDFGRLVSINLWLTASF